LATSPPTVTATGKQRTRPGVRARFGFAVKGRRDELRLPQEELAGRAGLHRTYLSDIERGSRNVGPLNIKRLAIALALPMAGLFARVERHRRAPRGARAGVAHRACPAGDGGASGDPVPRTGRAGFS
jgi:DNA-binding XRE family transcriptional regulator